MNKLLIVGTVAFDAIETPFGKTDKILGGAATFIGLSASHFNVKSGIVKGKQRYKCKDCGRNFTVEIKSTAKPNSY